MNHDEDAISVIIGTILLLGLAVGAMGIVYFNVLSDPGPGDAVYVDIVGTVHGTNIVLDHRGGEPLEIYKTNLSIIVFGQQLDINLSRDLDEDAQQDGLWNLGERVMIPFPLDTYTEDYVVPAEIIAVDQEHNSIAFQGELELEMVSDVSVSITSDRNDPRINDTVNFFVSVTNPEGIINASNITITFLPPNEFRHVTFVAPDNTFYNSTSGDWRIGSLQMGETAILRVETEFIGGDEFFEFTQLALLVDGSGSVKSGDWNIMRTGLSMAVKDETVFPHTGDVELTIVQFAGKTAVVDDPYGIEPIIITQSNADSVADDIANLVQRNGGTPLSCGFKRVADTLKASANYDPDDRQVINIVTDGMPNVDCSATPGVYTGNSVSYDKGKASASTWRQYLINELEMTEDKDEIDSVAVGILSGYYSSGPDTDWINESMIWPQPGCIAPPFDAGLSWVREVESWVDFYNATKEMFQVIFRGVWITAEVSSSEPADPNETNDKTQVMVVPLYN